MGELGGVDAGEADVDLASRLGYFDFVEPSPLWGKGSQTTHSPILQPLPLHRHPPPRHPPPPRQPSPGGMKQSEIIAIAHTRDFPKQTPFPPERRLDAYGLRDTAQVGAVNAGEEESARCEDDGGDDGTRVGVVLPVCGVEGGCPANGWGLLILGV